MKIKINAFLKWLALNEKSIAQIPDLRPDKKLFWIYWIHWHLAFYLPQMQFVLWFGFDSTRPVLHLFSRQKHEINHFLFDFRALEIVFHITNNTQSPLDWGGFEQYVIEDVTTISDHCDGTSCLLNFVEIQFRDCMAFSKFEQGQLLMKVWFYEKQCESHPVFVKLNKEAIMQSHRLLQLKEFDFYVDQINRTNR